MAPVALYGLHEHQHVDIGRGGVRKAGIQYSSRVVVHQQHQVDSAVVLQPGLRGGIHLQQFPPSLPLKATSGTSEVPAAIFPPLYQQAAHRGRVKA